MKGKGEEKGKEEGEEEEGVPEVFGSQKEVEKGKGLAVRGILNNKLLSPVAQLFLEDYSKYLFFYFFIFLFIIIIIIIIICNYYYYYLQLLLLLFAIIIIIIIICNYYYYFYYNYFYFYFYFHFHFHFIFPHLLLLSPSSDVFQSPEMNAFNFTETIQR